jgi:excisionase family DNA binding protein
MTRDGARPPGKAPADFLSTRELAQMLLVSEATVKRWTDGGLIPCSRTPGGHRRFHRADVEAFSRSHGLGGERPGTAEATVSETLRLALSLDLPGLERMAVGAIERGMSVEALCDEVLSPALVEIGHQWADGSAGIGDEHLVTSSISDLLSRLRILFEGRPLIGFRALVACAPGERHDIVSRMLSLCLRARGYLTVQLGADTPFGEVARVALARGIDVVALSGSNASQDVTHMRQGVASLWGQLQPAGIELFVGGTAFEAKLLPPGVRWAPDCRHFAQALDRLA